MAGHPGQAEFTAAVQTMEGLNEHENGEEEEEGVPALAFKGCRPKA